MVRRAIERLYIGVCDVIVQEYSDNIKTHLAEKTESTLVAAQPCRLSYKSIPTTGRDGVAAVTQAVKLFLSPEITVPEGSKIVVTQNGATTAYTRSGKPALYSTHQEIELTLFQRWA